MCEKLKYILFLNRDIIIMTFQKKNYCRRCLQIDLWYLAKVTIFTGTECNDYKTYLKEKNK